jgi:hypothetical protein
VRGRQRARLGAGANDATSRVAQSEMVEGSGMSMDVGGSKSLTFAFDSSARIARTQGGHNDGSGAFAVSSRTGHRNNGNAGMLRRAPIPRPGLG